MLFFLEKLKKKRNIINIRRKRKKIKKRRYDALIQMQMQMQMQNSNAAIFEIKRSFHINEKDIIICGRVKSGSFKTKDCLEILDTRSGKIKLKAIIKKITTTLVEVNKINSGFETDMLISSLSESEREIIPGDIASKVLISCKSHK